MPNRARQYRANKRGRTAVPRPSAHARGYGRAWRRTADEVLAAEPLCRHCKADGRVRIAREVDHIVPTRGIDDPKHFERSNLQPLCGSCHKRKTIADTKAGLTR